MQSNWGQNIRLTIFGESHGLEIGGTLEGFEAGIFVDMQEIQKWLSLRRAGGFLGSTTRIEADTPNIVCGIENGFTTGKPITVSFANTNTHSNDYCDLPPRPSHADFPATIKYNGQCDLRGGGHFSGRLTTPLVFFGALCYLALQKKGISITSHISSIKDVDDTSFDKCNIDPALIAKLNHSNFATISDRAQEAMRCAIQSAAQTGDSVGGTVETAITGLGVGVGSHMFCGIENIISSIIFGIPAVKGISFGIGFDGTGLLGSEYNDNFCVNHGKVCTTSNNCGGILGGMSNGMPVVFKTAIKPTPSISKKQQSVNLATMKEVTIEIKGRHDACILPRVVPCISMATALALYELLKG